MLCKLMTIRVCAILTATALCTPGLVIADSGSTVRLDGTAVDALIKARTQNLQNYAHMVAGIIAGKVREIRVEQEKAAAQQAGHAVPLPTGRCQVALSVSPDGTINHAQLMQCDSDALGKVELEAVQRASPLPPVSTQLNFTVLTTAPMSTPGVNGE